MKNINLNHIYHEDCIEFMKKLPDNYVDSIVCDPPYELGFMGKSWDNSGIAFNVDLWKEVLRILKPGGHLLAFSGTRTYHRMTVAIEDAGFEIRDMMQWVYHTGFPKSHDISKAIDKKAGAKRKVIGKSKHNKSKDRFFGENEDKFEVGKGENNFWNITSPATDEAKQWEGYGTALKPSHEPIVLARKPLSEKTIAENVLKWGTGGLNIDACRIGDEEMKWQPRGKSINYAKTTFVDRTGEVNQGRFPANSITLDDNSDIIESKFYNIVPKELQKKASKKDRNSDYLGEEIDGEKKQKIFNGKSDKPSSDVKDVEKRFMTEPTVNNHPTVKSIPLLEHLIKLITPPNGLTYDPFSGSGSTLVAAKKLGFHYLGTELEKDYYEIAKKRLHQQDEEELTTEGLSDELE